LERELLERAERGGEKQKRGPGGPKSEESILRINIGHILFHNKDHGERVLQGRWEAEDQEGQLEGKRTRVDFATHFETRGGGGKSSGKQSKRIRPGRRTLVLCESQEAEIDEPGKVTRTSSLCPGERRKKSSVKQDPETCGSKVISLPEEPFGIDKEGVVRRGLPDRRLRGAITKTLYLNEDTCVEHEGEVYGWAYYTKYIIKERVKDKS